jgi:BON domain
MDHRWDETLQAEHRRRAEEERYARKPITSDADVDRRDQLAAARQRVNRSPWEIGASHWDQRDLYTRNGRIDDAGYGRGPAVHPEVGSYAYPRDIPPASTRYEGPDGPTVFEREANPRLNYGPHQGSGPKGWRRSDASIREDVCEALAYHPSLDASDIEVTVKDGEVTLEGTVTDRGSKRLAESTTERCRGVSDVHNRLVVRKSDDDLSFTSPILAT